MSRNEVVRARFRVGIYRSRQRDLRARHVHSDKRHSRHCRIDHQINSLDAFPHVGCATRDVGRCFHLPFLPHERGSRRGGKCRHEARYQNKHQSSPCVISGGVGTTDSTQRGNLDTHKDPSHA